jgi:hypothetical protein
MYRAKRAGKARCEVSDTAMHADAVKRLRLETDLRKALEQGEFRGYYQPIVSLQTAKITGFEGLHPLATSGGRPVTHGVHRCGRGDRAYNSYESATAARGLPTSAVLAI